MSHHQKGEDPEVPLDISDDDIYQAMKEISGYLDVTPGDLKEVYALAYRHAFGRLTTSVKARDIMTREVAWVRPDTPLLEVAQVMAQRGVAGVPVLDETGKVMGVISETDFLARMGSKSRKSFMEVVADCLKEKGCKAITIRGRQAKERMTSPAVTVGEEATVMEITNLFRKKGINRVPVVRQDGRLVGIVSRADILKATYGRVA